jgi:hypothetical protein
VYGFRGLIILECSNKLYIYRVVGTMGKQLRTRKACCATSPPAVVSRDRSLRVNSI